MSRTTITKGQAVTVKLPVVKGFDAYEGPATVVWVGRSAIHVELPDGHTRFAWPEEVTSG